MSQQLWIQEVAQMRGTAVVLTLSLLSSPAMSSSPELNQRLYEAVNSFNAAAVGTLLKEGADPNALHATGYSALMRAVEVEQTEIVRLLLRSGADSNLRDGNGVSTAEISLETANPEVVEALLAGGADFDVIDSYGNSLVLRTVRSGRDSLYEIVDAFGRRGVNMDLGSGTQTPLHYAIEQDDPKMVRHLLDAGADPSLATGEGDLPLGAAVNNPEILALMLAAGADPNGIDADGNPVLFEAVFRGSNEAAEALIKAGADVNRPGVDGRTPLARARDGGAEDIARFLEGHGATGDEEEVAHEEPAGRAGAPDDVPPSHDEYPRMAELPVYPGAQTMYVIDDETHTANFISADALTDVAAATGRLLAEAGWQDAKHPHAKRVEDRHYVMYRHGRFHLITDIAIARGMGNQTAITYNIDWVNSSFGKMR